MSEERNMINEVPGSSPEFRTELAEQLAELAPEAIADGKIDVEKLKELLEGDASDTSERFGLFWPGKKRAMRAAQTPTTATLRPDKENSKNWDTTKNVFIEGDNLEVLKILQKHYHGKIKMIYIDPPYNTGKDFVYSDNYREGVSTYLEWSKQVNEYGKKLSSNSESEGRYHSNWLNMMYPRLKLARNLLRKDGAIAVSIDDSELRHLQSMMIEIFGEDNFYATVIWQKKYSPANDAKRFSDVHDYIVIFSRSSSFHRNLFPRTESMDKPYKNDDGDGRGRYRTDNLSVRTYSKSSDYPIKNPNTGAEYNPPAGGCWRYSKESMAKLISENRIYWGKDGTGAPQLKRYLSEVQQGSVPMTLWDWEFAGHTDAARKEIKSLFGTSAVFDTPKNSLLMQRLVQVISSGEDDLILDFFAGSGTTAHAVIRQNAEDHKNRRMISVQLDEPLLRDIAGYETIADVSRERIRLAGNKVAEDYSAEIESRERALDTGFRSYKLADSNFTKWRTDSDTDAAQLEQHLFELRESADDNATPEDLLTEILIKQGHSLVEQIRDRDIDGLAYKAVVRADDEDGEEDTLVLAYLDEHTKPTLAQLREAMEVKPAQFIMLEDAFQGDDELKTNLAQICKTNGIELWTA
ncbi:site-specific DNA-methyltransferase [Corynebacterium macclintockiae]|uniref:site-specific DNA-methyltransferase n=2 Tax=Corynebacterium macclintockiae TaxID=2913501 RepID=UPI003EBCEC10